MRIVTELEPSPSVSFYEDGKLSLSGRLFGGRTTTFQSKLYRSLIAIDYVLSRLHNSRGEAIEIDSRFVMRSLRVSDRFVKQLFMALLASCVVSSVYVVEEGRRTFYRVRGYARMPWEDGLDPVARASSILRGYVLAYDTPRSILLAFLSRCVPRIESINSFYSILSKHLERLYRYMPCTIIPCSESRIEPLTLRYTKDGVLLSAYAVTDLAIPLLMMSIAGLTLPAREPPYLRLFTSCNTKGCRKLLAKLWGLETPTDWLFEFYEHLSSLDVDSALSVLEKRASDHPAVRLTLSLARRG